MTALSSDRGFLGSWAVSLIRFVGLAVAGLVWTMMAARSLGDFGTGQVLLAVGLAPLLAPVVDLGVPAALTYQVAQRGTDPTGVGHLRWTAHRLALMVGAAFVPVAGVAFAIEATTDTDVGMIGWGLLAVAPSLVINFVAAIEQGRERFSTHAVMLLAPSLIALAITVLLELTGSPGPAGYVIPWVIGHALVAVVALSLSQRSVVRPSASEAAELRSSLLGYGWKVWLSEAAVSARNRLDLFLVGGMISTAAAGLYGGASRVAQQLGIVSQAANFVVFPMVARSSEEDRVRLTPVIARLTGLVAAIGAVAMAIVGRFVLTLLLGDDFEDAYSALLWYLPTVVFLAISRVVTADLNGRGRPDIMWKIAVATLVLSVGLNVVLIPPFGIEGAAAAASLTALVNLLLRAEAYRRITGIGYGAVMLARPSDVGFLLRQR